MRFDWKKKRKEIPGRVQVGPKSFYDVHWQEDLKDTKGNHLYGITDFDNKIITICMGMKPKITVETYFHELTHCFDHEFKIGLTEKQVLAIEHWIPYMFKDNNVWKKDK